MPLNSRCRRVTAVAAVWAFGLLGVACGDDDDTEAAGTTTTTTTVADGEAADEHEEYCDAVADMGESEQFDPVVLERVRDAAPQEISAEVDYVVDAFIAAEGDVGRASADPKVQENISVIEDFEARTCGEGGNDGGEAEAATEPLEGAQVVEITAVDHAYEGLPAEVPAGATSFRLTNAGEAAHEMQLFRLGDGVDLDELLARDEAPSPQEIQRVGGTEAGPGETVFLNVEDLAAGRYAVVCFYPGPDGKAHHDLGMKQTFTVS